MTTPTARSVRSRGCAGVNWKFPLIVSAGYIALQAAHGRDPKGREVMAFKLRDYQATGIKQIQEAFAQRHFRVLFVLPTGGGKTIIFAEITLRAAAKGNGVIILAHRQEIVDQISVALWRMGVQHGRIQPEHPMTDQLVQIGMVQTVARRLDTITEPKLLIIDEAHHAVAGTWTKILAAWPNARVLGVTATPERLDGRGLGDVFEMMVCGPDVQELIGEGYLAPFHYFAPPTPIDLSRVRSIGGDFNVHDLEEELDRDRITGDVVEHYLRHIAPRTAIAFCVTVAHAEHVALRFRDNGIPAASIDGNMPTTRRRDLVSRLRDGSIRVLTSCEIISEGFDAPAVGGAVLLRPTQSLALCRQQIGRCLRPKSDGSPAVILDHVNNVGLHGLPDAPHEWSLDSDRRESRNDRAALAASNLRTCRACNVVLPAGSNRDLCPMPGQMDCLFPRPRTLREREGQLEEVPPACASPPWADGIDIRCATGWEWSRLLEYAGSDPVRLRQIQAVRGYKPGWVFYAMTAALQRQRQRGAA
jgi:DNA repair protein RadD